MSIKRRDLLSFDVKYFLSLLLTLFLKNYNKKKVLKFIHCQNSKTFSDKIYNFISFFSSIAFIIPFTTLIEISPSSAVTGDFLFSKIVSTKASITPVFV